MRRAPLRLLVLCIVLCAGCLGMAGADRSTERWEAVIEPAEEGGAWQVGLPLYVAPPDGSDARGLGPAAWLASLEIQGNATAAISTLENRTVLLVNGSGRVALVSEVAQGEGPGGVAEAYLDGVWSTRPDAPRWSRDETGIPAWVNGTLRVVAVSYRASSAYCGASASDTIEDPSPGWVRLDLPVDAVCT